MPHQIINDLPSHIAIIMDGNGRWAKKHNMGRSDGHNNGVISAKNVVTACRKIGIKYLTLYAFSKENWKRPKDEVRFLFQLVVSFLKKELQTLTENDIRLTIFGDMADLPVVVKKALQHATTTTKHCQSMTVNLAFNYSGRAEILHAAQTALANGLKPEELTEEVFRSYLYSQDQPDPDIVIRTSGEKRLSNYLIFQTAYSEFFFIDTLWPDFTEKELYTILKEYGKRHRRFGLTQEQIEQ